MRGSAGVPDHCQLTTLSGDSLLENTKVRFRKDEIYTQVGSVLIAVNPFAPIAGLYGTSMMSECHGCRLGAAPSGPRSSSKTLRVFNWSCPRR